MSAALETPVFIVLEGLDGAGKTTCARALAGMLGAELMTTPSPEVRERRGAIIDSFGACQEAIQLFYLSTVFDASEKVRQALSRGRSVVMDRYFLSTQAYAEFRGSRLDIDSTAKLLAPAHLTVYLHAQLGVRAQRLRDRGCTKDDLSTLTLAADEQLRTLHRQKAGSPVVGRWMEIDNSAPDPQPALAQIFAWAKS
jgi:dTMP kinase